MNRKPKISPTRISTYLECPVKYRFVYIDRVGRRYQKASPETSLGSTLHAVLREFHAAGAADTLEELLQRLERLWVSAGYEYPEQADEFRMDGMEMLMAYHAAMAQADLPRSETILLEKAVRADMGPFILEGRADRIDRRPDGTLEIIDYKTSKITANAAMVTEDIRMGMYQLMVRAMYPDTHVVATVFNLRTCRAASSELISPSLFADDILSLGEELLARDYDAVNRPRSPMCSRCDFLPRCEGIWAAAED